MRKYIALALLLLAPAAARAAFPTQTVKISTNAITSRQQGTAVIAGLNVSTITASSVTITAATIGTLNVTSIPGLTVSTLNVTSSATLSHMTSTGNVTFQNAASTFTLLAPLSTSSVVAVGTTRMALHSKGNGAAPTWSYGGQVVNVGTSTLTTSSATTNTSFVRSGLAATVTPSLTSSSVTIGGFCSLSNSDPSSVNAYATLERNGTNLGNATLGMWSCNSGQVAATRIDCQIPIYYIDSPATTSATTYEVYFRISGAGTATINNAGSSCFMWASEIGGY